MSDFNNEFKSFLGALAGVSYLIGAVLLYPGVVVGYVASKVFPTIETAGTVGFAITCLWICIFSYFRWFRALILLYLITLIPFIFVVRDLYQNL